MAVALGESYQSGNIECSLRPARKLEAGMRFAQSGLESKKRKETNTKNLPQVHACYRGPDLEQHRGWGKGNHSKGAIEHAPNGVKRQKPGVGPRKVVTAQVMANGESWRLREGTRERGGDIDVPPRWRTSLQSETRPGRKGGCPFPSWEFEREDQSQVTPLPPHHSCPYPSLLGKRSQQRAI